MDNNTQAQNGAELDLQQIKALALAATTGEWLHERAMVSAVHPRANDADGTTVLAHFTGYFDEQQSNAAFCAAASPAVVLDLIARIERATAPHAAQLGLSDVRESLARAQAYPGFNDLPQPLRVEIDNAASILAKRATAPHGSAAAAPIEAATQDAIAGGTGMFRVKADGSTEHIGKEVWRAAAPVSGATPQVDALMAKWDDDGATRGAAFIELRDLARQLEADDAAHHRVHDKHGARILELEQQLRAARAAVSASQAAPVGGELARQIIDDTNATLREQSETMLALKVENDQLRAAVAAAKVPTVDQVADVVERLIGNVVLDWFGGRIDGDDEPFSSDAHERAYLCEMIRRHGRIGEVSSAPVEPESVPIPTTVNMARMMLALGHSYLKENAPEHLAAPVEQGQGATLSNSAELGAAAPVGPALREATIAVVERLGWTINGTWVVTKSGEKLHTADAIAFLHAVFATGSAPVGAGVVPETAIKLIQDIADWNLPATGKTWPSGGAVSYEAEHGSNGARDYMRQVASRALLLLYAATPTAATAHPVAADEQVRDTEDENWVSAADQLPGVPEDSEKQFIVACRRKNGKTYVFAADYLNARQLHNDDEGDVTLTGWYIEGSHPDYNGWFDPVCQEGDEVTHWMPMPKCPALKSRTTAHATEIPATKGDAQ